MSLTLIERRQIIVSQSKGMIETSLHVISFKRLYKNFVLSLYDDQPSTIWTLIQIWLCFLKKSRKRNSYDRNIYIKTFESYIIPLIFMLYKNLA